MRKLRFLLPLMLALGALAAPAPSAAIVPPADGGSIYFPGRPLRDDGVGNRCRALAYGRVNSLMVLFVANHCDYGATEGANAYTNGNVKIGTWGKRLTAWADNDLAYIILSADWIPSVASGMRNKIYRGSVTGSDYWTITSQPTVLDGCTYWPNSNPVVYVNYQYSFSTSRAFVTTEVASKITGSDGCLLTTADPVWPAPQCCVSGSPVIANKDLTTVAGIVTLGFTDGRVQFNSFREGLYDLDAYWDGVGNMTGAKLCIDADC